jgi:hypothetical protein
LKKQAKKNIATTFMAAPEIVRNGVEIVSSVFGGLAMTLKKPI